MSLYTLANRFLKMARGALPQQWGSLGLNRNLDLVDSSLDGQGLISAPLSVRSGFTDDMRQRALYVSVPSLTILPVPKYYYIGNVGIGVLSVSTGIGVGVNIPVGMLSAIVCDGVNCFAAGPDVPSQPIITMSSDRAFTDVDSRAIVYYRSGTATFVLSSLHLGWFVDFYNGSTGDLNLTFADPIIPNVAMSGGAVLCEGEPFLGQPLSTEDGQIIIWPGIGGSGIVVNPGRSVRIVAGSGTFIALGG